MLSIVFQSLVTTEVQGWESGDVIPPAQWQFLHVAITPAVANTTCECYARTSMERSRIMI